MTNKPEFKPCPFCGNLPRKAYVDTLCCNNKTCPIFDYPFKTSDWNTRAEPPATSSDEVEKALDQTLYDFGDGEERYLIKEDDWKAYRAHIAALTKEIETTKRTTAGHYLTWQCTEAGLREEITALEADNKRLREALEKVANNRFLSYENTEDSMYGTGVTDGHRLAALWALEALAKTDVKAGE